MKLRFSTRNTSFDAEFNDTVTAQEIVANLPITSVVSRWGDEIYFDIGFKVSAQNATMDIKQGDVAYWSQGKSLCVFFGLTPLSTGRDPVPASPVVIVGRTNASVTQLRAIEGGETIQVSLIDTQ